MAEDLSTGPTVVAQIVITLTAEGQLSVRGSTGDLIGAYGLLERAKDVVRVRQEKLAREAQSKILVPTLQPPSGLLR